VAPVGPVIAYYKVFLVCIVKDLLLSGVRDWLVSALGFRSSSTSHRHIIDDGGGNVGRGICIWLGGLGSDLVIVVYWLHMVDFDRG